MYFKVFETFVAILPIYFSVYIIYAFGSSFKKNAVRKFLFEFVILFSFVILSVTFLFKYNRYYAIPALLYILWKMEAYKVKNTEEIVGDSRLGFVTLARSSVHIFTSVSILAIDFAIAPGAIAKSKTYGASLMDTGIGLFICNMGVTWKSATISKLLKELSVFVVFGVGRTVAITLVDYNQDETEYGVHWNAFLTLGFTKFFGCIVCLYIGSSNLKLILASAMIMMSHELLIQLGLGDFILDKELERDTFFLANREGICSIPGCVAIFLLSKYMGQIVSCEKKEMSLEKFALKQKTLRNVSLMLWTLLICLIPFCGISRRLSNSGYVAFILSIYSTMLLLFMHLEKLHYTRGLSKENIITKFLIMSAINRNGLTYFLLSNFFTGFVNLKLEPRSRNNYESYFILIIYSLLPCLIVVCLYVKKIKIV